MDDCFVHASDLHLDAPLGDLGQLDVDHRNRLTNLATKAWDNLVELCISERASFLVLAGDVFDSAVAGVGVQLRFRAALLRLTDAGVRVFICHGNHDPLSNDFRPVGELPASVARFPPGDPQAHVLTLRNSADLIQVSGVSFGRQKETENLALRFRALSPLSGAVRAPHVAVLHANVGRNPGHDPYAPCSYEDLDGAGVDYWALGHIHKRDVRRLPAGGLAAYCGNLQGRSFKPSECEPKGALVVPVEQGRIGNPRFEPCDSVRFARREVSVTSDDSIGDVSDRLLQTATELGEEHEGRPVVWEVRLIGVSEEAARLRQAVENRELTDHLSEELVRLLGGGGLCRLTTAVRPAVNREAIAAGGDLRAHVLRDLQRLRKVMRDRDSGEVETDLSGTNDQLRRLLGSELPPALSSVWQTIVNERPERLDDLFHLAEELLLETYARAGTETP